MEKERKKSGHLLDQDSAAYDAAAKQVLSFRVLLAWITKYCTEEFRQISIDDIARKCIQGTPDVSYVQVDRNEISMPRIGGESTVDAAVSEGTITYDIRFRAVTPDQEPVAIILNVEAQKSSQLPYPLMKRVMYYLSRLVSAQKNVEFKGSDYGGIKKVYSIWLCFDTPHGENGITTYAMQETPVVGDLCQEKKTYDVMRAVMVYVGKEQEQQTNRLLKLLYLVFKANKTTDDKLQELKQEFDITFSDDERKELDDMCNLSAGIAERNYNHGLNHGIVIGDKQGRQEERISMLRNYMDTLHLTAQQAMDAAKIPKEEQEELKPYLKQ